MTQRAVIKIDGEVLTNFCQDCNCCLAHRGHCWHCHTTISIEALCGEKCGTCQDLVADFAEREAERVRNRRFKHDLRARALNS